MVAMYYPVQFMETNLELFRLLKTRENLWLNNVCLHSYVDRNKMSFSLCIVGTEKDIREYNIGEI